MRVSVGGKNGARRQLTVHLRRRILQAAQGLGAGAELAEEESEGETGGGVVLVARMVVVADAVVVSLEEDMMRECNERVGLLRPLQFIECQRSRRQSIHKNWEFDH